MSSVSDDFVSNEWVARYIMVNLLKRPKEIMNMGLVCKSWYIVAKKVLLDRPEARKITSLTDAYRLGWPCVIDHVKTLPENEKIYDKYRSDVLSACISRNRKALRRAVRMDAAAASEFAMGLHPRVGSESPVSILSSWVAENISSLATSGTNSPTFFN